MLRFTPLMSSNIGSLIAILPTPWCCGMEFYRHFGAVAMRACSFTGTSVLWACWILPALRCCGMEFYRHFGVVAMRACSFTGTSVLWACWILPTPRFAAWSITGTSVLWPCEHAVTGTLVLRACTGRSHRHLGVECMQLPAL